MLALVIIFTVAVFGQSCQKNKEFATCAQKAELAVAGCNSNVTNVPTASYYTCLCTGSQMRMQCYSLCPDDTQLQIQYQSQQ
jgi:hypothetical protein